MKHSFIKQIGNTAISFMMMVLLWFGCVGMMQSKDTFPLIQTDQNQLTIGKFNIVFGERTFKSENLNFTYDSIISIEAFQDAVETYFPNLGFDQERSYEELQDSVNGWKFEDLLNRLDIDGDGIDLNWRQLPLKDALGSSLINMSKDQDQHNVYIDEERLISVGKEDPNFKIEASKVGFISRIDPNGTIGDSGETTPESGNWWVLPLIIVLFLVLGALWFLRVKKTSISVNELQNFMMYEKKEPPSMLSNDKQEYLRDIKLKLDYQNEKTGDSNDDHEKIVVGYRMLENSITESTTLKDINDSLLTYFKGQPDVESKLMKLRDFMDQREELSKADITEQTIDTKLLDFLTILDAETNQNGTMFKKRYMELRHGETNIKNIIDRTRSTNDKEFLDKLGPIIDHMDGAGSIHQLMPLLKLFNIKEDLLNLAESTFENSENFNGLTRLLQENMSEHTAKNDTHDEVSSLADLRKELQRIVPGNRFDFKTQFQDMVKTHLYQFFLKSVTQRDESYIKDAKTQIIDDIKKAYQDLSIRNAHTVDFDLDTFMDTEIVPFFDLLVQYEHDFSKENKYLYQFHERFKGFSERLMNSEPLSPKDKAWLFQQLFTMAFHILDYLKIKLSLPKTDGSDLNHTMILNKKAIAQLNVNQYRLMTNSALETPGEVRHVLELAKDVNIEALDDVLFYGFHIQSEYLKNTADDQG